MLEELDDGGAIELALPGSPFTELEADLDGGIVLTLD
jgi:hypothetical protein